MLTREPSIRGGVWIKEITLIIYGFIAALMVISTDATGQATDSRADMDQTHHSFTIATATPGGTFYRVGYAIAALVTEDLGSEGIYMTAMNTDGSKDNVKLLLENQVQFALLQGFIGAQVAEGAYKFDKKAVRDELRAVAPVWPNVEHFVVLRDAIKNGSGTIDDLKLLRRTGKSVKPENKPRFSLGKRGSGTRLSGLHILEAVGVRPTDNFELHELDYSESADKLIKREIEGMNTPGGSPVEAVKKAFDELGSNIVVLSFEQKHLVDMDNADQKLWSMYSIEAGTYSEEQKDAVNTIAQPNILAVRKDVDDTTVCRITNLIYSNQRFFRNIHAATVYMYTEAEERKAAVKKLPFLVHPGAARYYENMANEKPCDEPTENAVDEMHSSGQ